VSIDPVLISNCSVADITQIHRLPFRRSHRQAVLPTRVQRVGIQCAAISDDCVAVLEDHRRLMKHRYRTPHATSKRSNKQASKPSANVDSSLSDLQQPIAHETSPPRRHVLLPGRLASPSTIPPAESAESLLT
jgi:hypothetical protein